MTFNWNVKNHLPGNYLHNKKPGDYSRIKINFIYILWTCVD